MKAEELCTPCLIKVVQEIARLSTQLSAADDQIGAILREIEGALRSHGVRRVISERLDESASLGWSQRKGYWRLVIVDDDDDERDATCEVLRSSREERAEILASTALWRVVERALGITI